jgi:Protein of unknown function (DUF2815)
MANARSQDFKTPLCRLSYAQSLFKARVIEEGKPAKFGATLIFPKSAKAELEKYVAETIIAEWGPKGIERAKAGLIKSPFLAGDGKEARNKQTGEINPGLGADVFFIRVQANEDRPPAVWWKSPNVQETEANVYSGCMGKAILNCFAWHNDKSGDGVSFGINGFQKHAEGERLGGSGPIDTEKWSETIADDGPAPDSTKSGAGAAGLFD